MVLQHPGGGDAAETYCPVVANCEGIPGLARARPRAASPLKRVDLTGDRLVTYL